MEGKKISFGFKKTKKIEKLVTEEKKDFIECVEEQSIKVVGGDNVEEEAPLVIAMKPNTLITTERLKQIAEEVESAVLTPEVIETPKSPLVKVDSQDETIEQMAVRELLQEAKKEVKVDAPGLVLVVPAQPKLEGQKESTLDDYESVPIQEFGLAMLRGMGWAPGKEKSKAKEPQLRPKGLGLGADTVLKQNQKKAVDKDGKELIIMKNAFVKVNVGKYKGCYGKVVSLDDDNGRVMVDLAMKKQTVSLSEFMMTAVTKSEYDTQSRVINADKYEEYKKKEQTGMGPKSSRHDSPKLSEKESTSRSDDISNRDRGRREERSNRDRESDRNSERDPESIRSREPDSSNSRNRAKDSRRRDSSSSEDRSKHRKRDKKKYSSHESLASESETDIKKPKKDKKRKSSTDNDSTDDKKQKKSKKHRRSESPKEKRDIDKKRKGKKKKRDRDRSPNYKKHRK